MSNFLIKRAQNKRLLLLHYVLVVNKLKAVAYRSEIDNSTLNKLLGFVLNQHDDTKLWSMSFKLIQSCMSFWVQCKVSASNIKHEHKISRTKNCKNSHFLVSALLILRNLAKRLNLIDLIWKLSDNWCMYQMDSFILSHF